MFLPQRPYIISYQTDIARQLCAYHLILEEVSMAQIYKGAKKQVARVKRQFQESFGNQKKVADLPEAQEDLPPTTGVLEQEQAVDLSLDNKGQMVLNELINTETGYVKDLMILQVAGKTIMANINAASQLTTLEKQKAQLMFDTINSLLMVHQQQEAILRNFQIAQSENNLESAKKSLEQLRSLSKIASVYSTQYNQLYEENSAFLNERNFTSKSDKKLWQGIQKALDDNDPGKRRLDLGGYTIKPVQRMLKYPLLFNELAKVDKAHPLQNAFAQMKLHYQAIGQQMNEAKRSQEQNSKHIEYQKYKKQNPQLRARSDVTLIVNGQNMTRDKVFMQLMSVISVEDYALNMKIDNKNPNRLIVRNANGNRIAEIDFDNQQNSLSIRVRKKHMNYRVLEAMVGVAQGLDIPKKEITQETKNRSLKDMVLNLLGSSLEPIIEWFKPKEKQQKPMQKSKALNVADEIVVTERNYLKGLHYLIDNRKAILEALSEDEKLTEANVKTVEKLIDLSENIAKTNAVMLEEFESLQQGIGQNDHTAIARHANELLKVAKLSQIYHGEYRAILSNEFMGPQMQQIFNTIDNKFYGKAALKEHSANDDFLLAVQRFPRYEMLMNDLANKMDQASPALHVVQKAARTFKEHSGSINERVKQDQGSRKFAQKVEEGKAKIDKAFEQLAQDKKDAKKRRKLGR